MTEDQISDSNQPSDLSLQGSGAVDEPDGSGDVGAQMAAQLVSEEHYSEFHSGPVPSPKTLAEYEKIVPGSAKLFVTMADDEQKARHRHNHGMRFRETAMGLVGLILGGTIALSLVVAAVYCATIGQSAVAVAFVASGMVAMVPAFLSAWRPNSSALADRSDEIARNE